MVFSYSRELVGLSKFCRHFSAFVQSRNKNSNVIIGDERRRNEEARDMDGRLS